MSDDFAEPEREARSGVSAESLISAAMGLSLLLTLATAIIGLNMALHQREAPCVDGTFIPTGTSDFTCYAHATGIVITLFSIVLATVVVLAGVAATVAVRRQSQRGRAPGN